MNVRYLHNTEQLTQLIEWDRMCSSLRNIKQEYSVDMYCNLKKSSVQYKVTINCIHCISLLSARVYCEIQRGALQQLIEGKNAQNLTPTSSLPPAYCLHPMSLDSTTLHSHIKDWTSGYLDLMELVMTQFLTTECISNLWHYYFVIFCPIISDTLLADYPAMSVDIL